jgi:hypothetical protein
LAGTSADSVLKYACDKAPLSFRLLSAIGFKRSNGSIDAPVGMRHSAPRLRHSPCGRTEIAISCRVRSRSRLQLRRLDRVRFVIDGHRRVREEDLRRSAVLLGDHLFVLVEYDALQQGLLKRIRFLYRVIASSA